MGMHVASFRVPYRGMPIIACYQFQAAKLRFFPETTKYFFFFLRNILEKSELFIHIEGTKRSVYLRESPKMMEEPRIEIVM